MKTAFSHIHNESRKTVEKIIAHHLRKLEALLKRYSPDLVQLHGDFGRQPRKTDFAFAVNLSLPTGTLHATGLAEEAPASVRAAFVELEKQLKKHKARLRKDYEWKRKRPRRALRGKEVA